VRVVEERDDVGGVSRTERPFATEKWLIKSAQ
jgi:hypothetical protein